VTASKSGVCPTSQLPSVCNLTASRLVGECWERCH